MPSSGTTTTFSLQVTLGYSVDNKAEVELNRACSQASTSAATTLSEMASSLFFSGTSSASAAPSVSPAASANQQDKFFVASASQVRLSMDPPEVFWKTAASLVAVFVPPHRVASSLERHYTSTHTSGSSFWIHPSASSNFAQDLLPSIHASLVLQWGCRIRGIILTSIAADNGPAEIVLLEIGRGVAVQDLLLATSGEALAADSECVLKVLPISHIKFMTGDDESSKKRAAMASNGDGGSIGPSRPQHLGLTGSVAASSVRTPPCIPICPVCIHRIDPVRLGLPTPTNQQLCSNFCPSPSLLLGGGIAGWGAAAAAPSSSWTSPPLDETCSKQRLLRKWPQPSRCKACHVIDHYWSNIIYGSKNRMHHRHQDREEGGGDLFCGECAMHKTLWVWYVAKCTSTEDGV